MQYPTLTIPKERDAGDSAVAYSDVYHKGGDRAIFAFQVVEFDGGLTGTCKAILEHKNEDDTAFAQVDTTGATDEVTLNATGMFTIAVASSKRLKELVRVKFENTHAADIIVETIEPVFFDEQA